ncbi:MAG: hypothetical protein R6V55_12595 [Desulfovermiculus sp.]
MIVVHLRLLVYYMRGLCYLKETLSRSTILRSSLQKVGENTYKLRGVPEQFNPNYHDDGSAFDQGVAR